MDQNAVDDLVKLLDLEPIEVNIFRGASPDEDRQRVFGGQVAGQALVAAARTVSDDVAVHSLHAYFLRAGDPTGPDPLRGRPHPRRPLASPPGGCVAIQHGRPIFNLSASFQTPEEGFDHQFPMPEGLPDPEDAARTSTTRMAPWKDALGDWYDRPRPIDTRYCDWQPPDARTPLPPFQNVWFRAERRAARRPGAPHLRR